MSDTLRPATERPAARTADPTTWGAENAHDPTVVQGDDGRFYMFSTDAAAGATDFPTGAHIRVSDDLVEWTFAGTALGGVPAAAAEWTGAAGIWAPEVVRWTDGSWHMYYSASSFGSKTSAIGLAVADDPLGPWVDRGIVVATREGADAHNAIDAAVVFDGEGVPWLTYGSFFGGIHTVRLTSEGDRTATPGDLGTLVAWRPRDVDGAVEGVFVLRRPTDGRYVMFASYDSLFSTYNVRVAVADDVTGPYRDVRGAVMTEPGADPHRVGTKILGSYAFAGDTAWLAPGHNSVLTLADGTQLMVHHTRRAGSPHEHTAQLRRLAFTATGWPLVSPQPFAGFAREAAATADLSGPWQIGRFAPESTDAAPLATGEVHVGDTGSDALPQQLRLEVRPHGAAAVELDAVLFPGWDAAAGRATVTFSGLDADGVVWFGTRGVAG